LSGRASSSVMRVRGSICASQIARLVPTGPAPTIAMEIFESDVVMASILLKQASGVTFV
jgi:hypothetical protein